MGNFRCLAAALLVAAGQAAALEWSAAVGADARWFDWREHQDDKQLLMETGPLAAPLVELKVNRGQAFASVNALWGGGLTRYDGHLQPEPPATLGAGHETEAWEEIIEAEWRLGWEEEKGRVHFGLLQRDWRRFIESSGNVSSAEERYRWKLVTFGGEAALFDSPDWRVALNIGFPVDSYQKVYIGGLDDFSVEPGHGLFWRLSFPFQPANRNLRIEPYYQQQDMDESDLARATLNGVPQVDDNGAPLLFYQPESIRRELGISLIWRIGGSPRGDAVK